jgi:hypothetical protein
MSRFTAYTGAPTTLHQFVQSRDAADKVPPKKEYLFIDSRDRDVDIYPDPGKYVVTLPEKLYNVSKITLIGAEVPSSFYVFTADRGNTFIKVTYGGQTKDITIPDGNYGFDSMVNTLQDALNEAFGFNDEEDPNRFRVSITQHTLRLKIEVGTGNEFDIHLTAASREWPLTYFLGLGRYSDQPLRSNGGVLEGSRVVSLNPELYICLDIAHCLTIMEPGIDGEQGTMGRTSAKIPLDVDSFQYMFFDTPILPNTIEPPLASLTTLDISFRFHDGTPIHFNGVNHALTFEIECTSTR